MNAETKTPAAVPVNQPFKIDIFFENVPFLISVQSQYLRGATTLVTPESKVEKCNDLGIIFQE